MTSIRYVGRELATIAAVIPPQRVPPSAAQESSSHRRSDGPASEEKRKQRDRDVLRQLDIRINVPIAVGAHTLQLTHLDRVYWPADQALSQAAVTKRDLLRYFAQVSPFILPHLADRPLTMIRMPDGIHGQRFFQKHWEQEKPPFARTITVFSEHKDESHEYLLCNDCRSFVACAVGARVPVWHSRAQPGPYQAQPRLFERQRHSKHRSEPSR